MMIHAAVAVVYIQSDISIISQVSDSECETSSFEEDNEEAVMEDVDELSDIQKPQLMNETSRCPGFVIVIDNVDMNVRRSDQRIGRTSRSYHFCHGYAVLNRVDSAKLEDRRPSGVLSLDQILPTNAEIGSILDECTILIERYI